MIQGKMTPKCFFWYALLEILVTTSIEIFAMSLLSDIVFSMNEKTHDYDSFLEI